MPTVYFVAANISKNQQKKLKECCQKKPISTEKGTDAWNYWKQGSNTQNFYLLKIHFNLFEIPNQVLRSCLKIYFKLLKTYIQHGHGSMGVCSSLSHVKVK